MKKLFTLLMILIVAISTSLASTTPPTGGPHKPGTTSTVKFEGRDYEVFFSNNASKSNLLVGSNTSTTTESTSTSSWCNIGSSCGDTSNNISTAFTLNEFISNVKSSNNKAISLQSTAASEKNIVMVVEGYDSIAVFGKSNDLNVYAEIYDGEKYGTSSALALVKSLNKSSHYRRAFALDNTKRYRLTIAYGTSGTTNKYFVGFSLCVPAVPATAHTVSFNAGDHGTYTGGDITEESAGDGITLPDLTTLTDGYIFNGWYTASTGGDKAGNAGATYHPSDDVTVYAQYSEIPTPTFGLSETSIEVGQTAQIKVTGKDDLDGVTLSDISYGTADIVTVNATTGVVTPVAAGSTTITFNSSAVAGKYKASSGNLSITVTAPKCATPTIAVGDFNFENKGYKVTITNNEDGSTLKVSTDGSSYTTQTSPYETYATATTHYYAKAEKTSYEDSEVADENVTNTFDGEKKFIAWVHGTDGNYSGYNADEDPMVIALKPIYNVIPVGSDKDTAPKGDLSNADLIVCTEAMTGKTTFSNGMVALLDGTAPMIGLKMFNYGDGKDATKRWAWGTPANPGSTTLGFTAKNANYKVLDGVTFESDGTIKLATAKGTSDNVIQTVSFTGASKPADNVILGTLNGDDTKAVMHYSATKKYFGLGLSVDCRANYTANATTIVKNAAAMLIAGDDLTATSSEDLHQKVAISTSAGNTYATYVTNNNLDFTGVEGITAYIATGDNGSTITTQAVTEVPTGTALLIKTAEAGATVNVPVTTSTPATLTDNKLKFSNESLVITDADATAKRYYGFFKVGEKYGFAPMAAGTLAAKKAYLDYGVDGNSLQFIALDLEDAPTAINFVEAENNANSAAPIKVIKNGKLYIGNYNVAGQLVK